MSMLNGEAAFQMLNQKANKTNQADPFFVRAAHKKWSAYL